MLNGGVVSEVSRSNMRQHFDGFQVRAADDLPNSLVLVLDTAVTSWVSGGENAPANTAKQAAAALQTVTEQLLVFLNTFLLQHDSNRVYVLLSSCVSCDLVYPTLPDADTLSDDYDIGAEDNMIEASSNPAPNRLPVNPLQAIQLLRDAVCSGVKASIDAQSALIKPLDQPTQISNAIARALCLLNRAQRLRANRAAMAAGTAVSTTDGATTDQLEANTAANGRVLTIMAGMDSPAHYIPVMNCMFSAQRIRVPIDSCVVCPKDSTYLQQAAHVTQGVYMRVDRNGSEVAESFLQTLQTVFLIDRQSRDFLAMPAPESVDFRANCMRTNQVIEDGYTCSVCLSTFGKEIKGAPMCPVCNARYFIPQNTRRRR